MSAAVVLAAEKFWILDPLYTALGTLLAWFYSVIPSYAFAIVLLTLAVRIVTLPLTAKQARAQQQMQQLQPELKRLQAKYKHDRQKLNEEVMKFYKENHASPFGSCLPVLIQMPILIVLYRLILGLSDKDGPKHVPSASALFEALKESGGEMASWGMDLARSAAAVSGADKLPYLVLVALVVATGYYQQRQLTARVSKENMNPQMAMMTKVFPVIFGFVSFSIPAGVVVYFLVSNIWQIGQQAVLFRNQPAPADAGGGKGGSGGGKAGKPKDKGGGAQKGRGATTGGRTAAKGPKGSGGKAGAKPAGAKGAGAKPSGAKGAGTKGGPAKAGTAKGAPPKGTKGKGSGRVTPRDDRVKSPGAKSGPKGPPGRGGASPMGAMGGRAGGGGPTAKKAPPGTGGGGGPGGQGGKRKRRGRRGRPETGAGGVPGGNGVTPGGAVRDGSPPSSGDARSAGDGAPASTAGEDAQKGDGSWSG